VSTTRDKKGRWTVRIHHRQPDGKIRRVERTSAKWTRRQAEKWERDTRQALVDGTFSQPQKEVPTLRTFAKEFMATYARANNKPSERITKDYMLRLHLLPALGDKRLDAINMRDVERFKAAKLEAKLAPKSINNMLTVLGRILGYAVDLELLESKPRIKFLKVPPAQFDFLDFGEAERLVAGALEPDALAAVLCGLDAGMRAGEIQGLQWDDVDFVSNQLTVQRTIYRGHVGSPKGGRLRVLPMTSRLARALRRIRHLRGPWVFCERDGGRAVEGRGGWSRTDLRQSEVQPGDPWSRGEIDTRLRRSCRRAGLRKIGWHVVRHSFCSHLAMRGAPARAIQELAGHASLTTAQRYMHLSPAAKNEAIKLLEGEHGHSTDSEARSGATGGNETGN
jgi:integrase